jgi:hypothetical protein
MGQVSQGRRRKWTPRDQAVAEVAAACGVSFRVIAAVLKRAHPDVRRHLVMGARKRSLESTSAYRVANKSRIAASDKAYQKINRLKIADYRRSWRQANRERNAAKNSDYYLSRREYFLGCRRAHYSVNRDRYAMRNEAWRRENPEKAREVVRRRKARIRAGRNAALQPLTLAQKDLRWGMFGHACAYCGVSCATLTVDHVLALTSGGLDEADNVIPACRKCNCSKHTRSVEEWYRRQPFFTESRWRKIQRHCPTATGQATLRLLA